MRPNGETRTSSSSEFVPACEENRENTTRWDTEINCPTRAPHSEREPVNERETANDQRRIPRTGPAHLDAQADPGPNKRSHNHDNQKRQSPERYTKISGDGRETRTDTDPTRGHQEVKSRDHRDDPAPRTGWFRAGAHRLRFERRRRVAVRTPRDIRGEHVRRHIRGATTRTTNTHEQLPMSWEYRPPPSWCQPLDSTPGCG